jgi:glutamyl-tRNA synthetase
MKKVRVRFAPSPTGPLHIGGIKTALYNYLFAKKHGGDFLLRIEDTDQNRFVPGAEEYILESLKWCGIEPNEGVGYGGKHSPYKQSERKEIYNSYAEKLVNEGFAYYGFDSVDELNQLRETAQNKGESFTYGIFNRNELKNSLLLDKETIEQYKQEKPFVIRFKIPENETIVIQDQIRGNISIDTNSLDDKIIFKSDGLPTYHLANVVDDHLMEISHVIRGEEWLPSTALHILLYKSLGLESPLFAHLPLILKPEGKGKLSKREGDKHGFPVFPLEWKDPESGEIAKGYREEGYLPEALINMLALLGWHPEGEKEIFSLSELSNEFSLEKVSKAGAKFNLEKAIWFNHQHIQQLSNEEITTQFEKILTKKNISPNKIATSKLIQLVKERINFMSDLWNETNYFYESVVSYDPKSVEKVIKEDTKEILENLLGQIQLQPEFSKIHLEEKIKNWISESNLGFGKVMQPFRLALVGAMRGPDVFDIIELLGKDETENRIKNLIAHIS